MKRLFSLFFLTCLLSGNAAMAQTTADTLQNAPIVEYINGDKHIHVDRTVFSPNMTVWEFLHLLPELNTRGSNDVLNNYAIVIDEYSLGVKRDAVLYQMTIGELQTIIISDNPSVAYAQNGTGGVIELVPRDLHDRLSGNAQIDVSSSDELLASANLNARLGKWDIRSSIKSEFLHNANTCDIKAWYGNDNPLNSYTYTNDNTATTELAKIAVTYRPTERDELNVRLWETYGSQTEQSHYVQDGLHGYNYDTTRTRGLSTLASLQYAHTFTPRHTLSFNATYEFAHSNADNDLSQPHDFNFGARYNGKLVQKNSHNLTLVTGGDFTYDRNLNGDTSHLEAVADAIHVSPMLELRYAYGDKVYARLGGRYHYDKFTQASNLVDGVRCHDYNLSGEVCYSPTKPHTIRLSGARDRITLNAVKKGYVASADLSYIFSQSFGQHFVNVTGGFQYNYAALHELGHYNIYAAKAGIVWNYRWICLSFSGQLFENESFRTNMSDYHLYYNLRLYPIFTLRKGWSISANIMYNSPLISQYIIEGDYLYTSLRVSKQINQWSVHLEIADPFHIQTSDRYYIENEELGYSVNPNLILVGEKIYYPYRRYISLGVMYEF